MFTITKQLLVLRLVVAMVVMIGFGKSASALPLSQLPADPTAQQAVINRIIAEEFPAYAVATMQRIAICESGGLHRERGVLVANRSGTGALGVLQLEMSVHRPVIDRLRGEGMDVLGDVRAYMRFMRMLYDRDRARGGTGFRPWPRCSQRITPAVMHVQHQRQHRRPTLHKRRLVEVAEAR